MNLYRDFFPSRRVPFNQALKMFVGVLLLGALATDARGGLVSHWSFDEGSGFQAADTAGSNDGFLLGDPTWSTGVLGGGMTFDGSDDQVIVYDDASLNPDRLTVSAWVRSTATTIYTGIVDKWSSGGYMLDFHTGDHLGTPLRRLWPHHPQL